jgi:hypothetical protein
MNQDKLDWLFALKGSVWLRHPGSTYLVLGIQGLKEPVYLPQIALEFVTVIIFKNFEGLILRDLPVLKNSIDSAHADQRLNKVS